MKKTRVIIAILFALLLSGVQMTPVHAIDSIPTETVEKIGNENSSTATNDTSDKGGTLLAVDEDGNVVSDPSTEMMGNVTVEEVNEKLTTKIKEVISVVQNIGIPLCVLMFILSLIVTVIGAITKRGAIMQGCIAMAVCVVCYTAIVYAYDIVAFASNWLIS